ncbi:MFS transporter [Bordetella pseudohinzii]|uniref:MFS transporter n=2 Tax=Bordetella pseudohinzii TaxID=1331258 RepID=A0ABM6DH72_9BORD|nr:MFS transporter [Bordetella pseudohinzii]ANY16855.1 MFS transporter [Bordetella pseudohinzii]KMM24599.1 MFS transporter [Bordetella pseudohinzii]KXA75144.1 MFS transporter [Bordetella pseudohinzii]KXA77422.1 MFS transporter [Bordetella pseudohinzii]
MQREQSNSPPASSFFVVLLAGVSVALHIGKLPPAVAVLQEQLQISLVQAGFLLSAIQLAGMCLGMVVGLSADRWGLKRSMIAGLVVVGLASIVGSVTTEFAALLSLRALEGFGLLLVAMPAPSLIRRFTAPNALPARMGWWSAYVPIGSATALLVGPWVIQWAGWKIWWAGLGILCLAVSVAVHRIVPTDTRLAPQLLSGASQAMKDLVGGVLLSAGPWLLAASFMLYSAQWMSVLGFLPSVYSQAGLRPELAGALTAVVAAVNIIGNVTSGRLLQGGWPPRRCLQIGFLGMGVGSALAYMEIQGAPLLPAPARFFAIVCFSAVGGMIPSSLFNAAIRLSPSTKMVSATVGWMQQLSCVGQFFGPPAVAAIATVSGGWQATWIVTASLCGIGAALAMEIQKRWSTAVPA